MGCEMREGIEYRKIEWADSSWQITDDTEMRGHGDSARRSEVGDRKSEVRRQMTNDR